MTIANMLNTGDVDHIQECILLGFPGNKDPTLVLVSNHANQG